jgi:TIR domain
LSAINVDAILSREFRLLLYLDSARFITTFMAYLPGFEHDIFISYSHVDDQDGWVEVFQKQLEMALSRRLGRMDAARVWRDRRRLQGNHLFDQTIQNAIDSSALFVALTSKGYLESDYCRKELRWFREKNTNALSVGDRSRMLNVLLANIHYSGWPEEFNGASGQVFHDAERDDEFGYPSNVNDRRFTTQMRQLCEAIYATLEEFKKMIDKPAPPAPPSEAGGGFTVFLADTADSLSALRSRVRSELRQQGVNLTAPIPPPYDSARHDERVIAELGRANLSVHLLNEWPGREIDGAANKTYPQRQAELGLQQAKSQLIWVPQSLDIQTIEDQAHRDFLRELEEGKRDLAGYKFIREPQSAITREIINRLDELKQESAAKSDDSAVLLETHLKDQLHAFDLGRSLTELNIRLHLHSEGDEPGASVRAFEESLRKVDRLIIVFGSVDEYWVRGRLGDAVKFAITARHPLKSCGVYFAPPRNKSDNGEFKLPLLPVYEFDSRDLADPQSFIRVFG